MKKKLITLMSFLVLVCLSPTTFGILPFPTVIKSSNKNIVPEAIEEASHTVSTQPERKVSLSESENPASQEKIEQNSTNILSTPPLFSQTSSPKKLEFRTFIQEIDTYIAKYRTVESLDEAQRWLFYLFTQYWQGSPESKNKLVSETYGGFHYIAFLLKNIKQTALNVILNQKQKNRFSKLHTILDILLFDIKNIHKKCYFEVAQLADETIESSNPE